MKTYEAYIKRIHGGKENQNGLDKNDVHNCHVRTIYYSKQGIHAFKEIDISIEHAKSEIIRESDNGKE